MTELQKTKHVQFQNFQLLSNSVHTADTDKTRQDKSCHVRVGGVNYT